MRRHLKRLTSKLEAGKQLYTNGAWGVALSANIEFCPHWISHFFLGEIQQTILTVHHIANLIDRISAADKSHGAAAVRKIGIPGDIIKNAFVTINGHSVKFRIADCRFRILNASSPDISIYNPQSKIRN